MNRPKSIAVQPAPHVPWDVLDGVLLVGSGEDLVRIDLAERRTDSYETVDVTRGPAGLVEGIHGPYVLSVEIPPKRHEGDGGSVEPLDIAAVTIHLWTTRQETGADAETEPAPEF
ncbi:MAG: hypothetical protein LBP98_07030 [Tannerella sp.]|jgi:hypothetical protein|nr:hypothetical protein [Tannerella sp.]